MDVLDNHFMENKTSSEEEMQMISMRIIDDILKDLQKLKKAFKYAVTLFIGQKFGTAVNHSSKNELTKSLQLWNLKQMECVHLQLKTNTST